MPFKESEAELRVSLWLTVVLVIAMTAPSSAAQDPVAPEDGAPALGSQASPAPPDPQAAPAQPPSKPLSPAEAYQLDQRKQVLALRRMNQSLLTPEILKSFQRDSKPFRTLISQGAGRNPKDMEVIRSVIAFKVLQLSDPDVQKDPFTVENALKSLQRDIDRAGSQINSAQTKKQFREVVCKECIPHIQALLQNNLLARSLAMEVLQGLEVVPPQQGRRTEMFDQVDDIFVEVLNDPKQPDAVKLRVANSVVNYLQKADALPQVEVALAESITGQLQNALSESPYQLWLLAALEEVKPARQQVAPKKNIVFESAATVLRDSSRSIEVRCRAARVLGRAGYDNQVDFEPLAWAVADLTAETAVAANRGSVQDRTSCGYYLYTAFHHWERGENANPNPKGFLNRAPQSTTVREAYEAALPVIRHLIAGSGNIPVRDIGAAIAWTTKNKPASLSFDPTCAPLAPPRQ